MEAFIQRARNFDPNRLALAPLFGLLAGFLANRAFSGATGWALLAEMLLGAALVTFGAAVMVNLRRLIEERDHESAQLAAQRQLQAEARKQAYIDQEAERYQVERFFREQVLTATRRTERIENELHQQRADAQSLRRALASLSRREAAPAAPIIERLERLERSTGIAVEAREKILALEAAQERIRNEQFQMTRQAVEEVEEVKASLLKIAITESQRTRNIEAPDNDQSGRIIELEGRIRKLAREIEVISSRQVAAPQTGIAGQVTTGARDNARLGFLQAMLDANKTLRKRINEAA